jgi:acetyl esterase/lipase
MREFDGARYHTTFPSRRKIMISRSLVGLFALLLGACASPQMANRLASDSGYKLVENQPYERSRGLDLDVYYPPQASAAPVVVFFHGGRWSLGNKTDFRFVGQALSSRGFIAVIPNVRKYPQVRFPDFVDDAAHAVRWARENARSYGGDPDQLFVMGHSSGAHIAALLALNPEYLKAAGADREQLRGMIGLAGAYDFMPITAPDLRDLFGPVERFRYAQPVFYVDGQNPPLLLMHGRNDDVIPAKNTESLARQTAKSGGPVETVLYDSLSHAMILNSMASYLRGRADVLDNIEEFVKRIGKQPRRVRRETEILGTPLIAEQLPSDTATELPPPQPLQIEPGAPLQSDGPIELPPVEMAPQGAAPAPAEDDPWAFLGPVPTPQPGAP